MYGNPNFKYGRIFYIKGDKKITVFYHFGMNDEYLKAIQEITNSKKLYCESIYHNVSDTDVF